MATNTIIFTCCGGSGGRSILRSLQGDPRYRLIGVDTAPLAAGLYDPGLANQYLVPPGNAPDYVDTMLDIVKREGASIVWPCSDEEVISLSRQRERFEELGAVVVTAAPEVVDRAVDKLAMVDRVQALGIPVPQSARLDAQLNDFPYPLIVRPISARGGHGVTFHNNLDSINQYRDDLGDQTPDYFAQECLDYRQGNLHMAQAIFGHDEQLLARFASRSITTMYDWGGPALGGVPVQDETLHDYAYRVFKDCGPWLGPVNAEFLYVPERGDYVFIEVNPRYWGYSFLATAAGINFPDITIQLFLGEQVDPITEYSLDVFTLTSREQTAYPMSSFLGEFPGALERQVPGS